MSYWILMSISPSFTLTSQSDLSKQQIWSNDTLLCILLRTKQNTQLPSPEQETLTMWHFNTSLSSSATSPHGLSVYPLQSSWGFLNMLHALTHLSFHACYFLCPETPCNPPPPWVLSKPFLMHWPGFNIRFTVSPPALPGGASTSFLCDPEHLSPSWTSLHESKGQGHKKDAPTYLTDKWFFLSSN